MNTTGLNYEPTTGLITRECGGSAEYRHPKGYMYVSYKGVKRLSHRVAWFMHYGEWPCGQVDHINGDPSDNRICNLRVATPMQNAQSLSVFSNNKSGVTGVHWHKGDKRWHASISANGRRYFLGSFLELSDAKEARDRAKRNLHEFQPENRENHYEGTKLNKV